MPRVKVNTDEATRAQICTLKAPAGGGLSNKKVSQITGVPATTIGDIYRRAIRRGFDPLRLPLTIRNAHVQDAPRTGRPLARTETVVQKVTQAIQTDRFGREKTCQYIATELRQ